MKKLLILITLGTLLLSCGNNNNLSFKVWVSEAIVLLYSIYDVKENKENISINIKIDKTIRLYFVITTHLLSISENNQIFIYLISYYTILNVP